MSEVPQQMKVTAFNRRFVGFIARHPIAAILTALGVVAATVPGLGRVKADFTHAGFFEKTDPKLMRFEAFERRFGNDDAVVIAVHSPTGVFDMDTATLLRDLTSRLWKIPEIIRVDSLTNFNWVHANGDDIVVESLFPEVLTPEILLNRRQIALSHEALPNYLISKDGLTAMVYGHVKPGLDHPPDAKAITEASRKLVEEFTRGDNQLFLGGGPPITFAFEEVTQKDVSRLIPLALGISTLFLAFLLRSVAAVVLPLLVVILSVVASFGLAGWTGMTQTAMSTALPTILIAIGIADTVHVLITYVTSLRQGMARKDAAHYALTKNLLATFLTSLTTAIGFLSFVTAQLKPLSVLGYMAAFGTLVAWVLTQLLVGGLMFVLPIKVKPFPPEKIAATKRRAHGLVDLIIRRRFVVIGVTAFLSVAAFVYSIGLDVNSDSLKYFDSKTPVRIANEFVEKTMGAARSFELVIDSGVEDGVKDPAFLAKVDALQSWIEARPHMTRAVSILDVLKQTHRSLNGGRPDQYRLGDSREVIAQELFLYTMGLPQGMDLNDRVSVKNDALRMTVLNNIITSREAVAEIRIIEKHAQDSGLKVQATGKYLLYQESNEYVVGSFVNSLWSASLLIGLIMIFFLRSVKLGIISMLPNVLPLFAGGALLRIIGQPLDMGTAIVASICLGISIDDTCHVLANFAYLRRNGMAPNEAMRDVMNHAGPALLSTNGVLIASFASFATASFVPNFYFGILTAFILAVALVADIFLTPALVVESLVKEERRAAAPAPGPDAVPAG